MRSGPGSRTGRAPAMPRSAGVADWGSPNPTMWLRCSGHAVGMASGVATFHVGTVELISMWVDPVARGRGSEMRSFETSSNGLGHSALECSGSVWLSTMRRPRCCTSVMVFRYTGELGDVMRDGMNRERVMEKSVASHL